MISFNQYIKENIDYRGEHRAPDLESGAPSYDLTLNGIYPKDVYDMPNWYEIDDGLEEMRKIIRLKGRPDASVHIYRAIPKEIYKNAEKNAMKNDVSMLSLLLNRGDWVTTSRKYAKDHGDSALNGNYNIIAKTVKASEIYTNGDSIFEWGYFPN